MRRIKSEFEERLEPLLKPPSPARSQASNIGNRNGDSGAVPI